MNKYSKLLMAMLLPVQSLMAQEHAALDEVVSRFRELYNAKKSEQVAQMFSERIRKILPPEKSAEMLNQLYQQYGEMKTYTYEKQENNTGLYRVKFSGGELSLAAAVNEKNELDAFRFLPIQNNAVQKSDFVFKTQGGKLYGSFTLPDVNSAVPVVLIIPGSGPTDRNGNQDVVTGNTYKMIADSLKNAGIASLRYDKRGVGESHEAMKDEHSLRFEDMVNDAAGIVAELKADKRFSSIFVLGHSEGSLVGMMAAAKEPVAGFISVAGLGNAADKIMVRQIAAQSEELSLKAAFILDSLQKGKTITDPGGELSALFRPSVQPYIKSWIKYDPQTEIRKLKIPVLIVQGTNDLQVPESEALTLREAYPDARMKIIKDMNHVLKQAPNDRTKNIATYSMPTLPLAPGLMATVTQFIIGAKK
jgi:hypothetical protein